MRELKTSNHLLGNRAALADAFKENGYLFFRDVLDKGAIARLRRVYMDTLYEIGVVDPQSDEPIWNGASLANFVERMKSLTAKEPWKRFRDDPKISDWFRYLIGEDYIWLPLIVYRVTPPALTSQADREATSRFRLVHQDGFFNDGLKFMICWMPLSHIDEEVGGMAIAEGYHRHGYLHDRSSPPMFDIPKGAIPDDAWTRTNFEPGDLLIQHDAMPHTGITNQSNRFRLSMDFRLMPKSSDLPIIGNIVSIDRDQISLWSEEDNKSVSLRIDDETFCRGKHGSAVVNQGWIPRDELKDYLKVGQGVMVTGKEGKAGLIRPFDILHRA
jgi:hypothetical protein